MIFLDIRQLRYFIEVANTRNFSAAARNLFITQPALSYTIKQLEDELGQPLLQKTKETFNLTETGLLLYERANILVEQFDQMITEVKQHAKPQHETIKVGLTVLFAIQFMQEISNFIATHPNVELRLIQEGSHRLQQLLKDEVIDIALLSFPLIEQGIEIEPLQTTINGYSVSVVIPNSNPLATKKALTFKQLEGQNFSSLTDDYMLGRLLSSNKSNLGFKPNIIFKHGDWEVLVHSLNKLDTICILPSELQKSSRVKDVTWLKIEDKNNFYPIGIALRKNYICSVAVSDFINCIKQN